VSAPASRRGTSNSNRRGNSLERAARRAWLVVTYGDGLEVLCFHCGTRLTTATVSCDRIRPGVRRGTYARGNIRPSCLGCNVADGGRMGRARQLGRTVEPIKLTPAQHRVLIRVRCHPKPLGFLHLGPRYRRTVEVLARYHLVYWVWGSNGVGTVLTVGAVNPLRPEGVTL
jgi:hypothetical protein